MIKAVIFDLDGTLLDTIGDIAAAQNMALGKLGFPSHSLADFGGIIGGGIMEAIRRAAPEGTPEETLQELNRHYQAWYPEHCTELTHPYEGMSETLEGLEKSGLTLAVLTNKTERTAMKMTKLFFPDTDFKFIWGNNGERPLKPTPDSGSAACALLELEPDEVAYVGDSDVDMQFANATGMLPVGACWGYRGRVELEAAGASVLCKNPPDLLKLI